jgi:hypothetical protein
MHQYERGVYEQRRTADISSSHDSVYVARDLVLRE